MRFFLLPAGVSLVVLLGLLIDAQSRTPVRRPAARSEPARIFAPGRIEGTTPEVELRPRVPGRIVEIRVEEGQRVRKGDVLLRLDDEQGRHQVAMAAAELALAEAQLERLVHGARPQQRAEAAALYQAKLAELERAELSWGRIDDLRQARAVSQQEADDKRTLVTSLKAEVGAAKARLELLEAPARPDEVEMDKARIKAAEAQLQLANVGLEWTNLRAPRDGQILRVGVETGELTGPNAAEASVVMVDTSRFYVRVYVEEQDAPRVRVGMTATIVADGLPGEELKGRVVRLSPRMSRKELLSDNPGERHDVKTREVWIELEGARELVVGLPVDVILDVASRGPVRTERGE
jgi:HlyD family secretion protein